MCVRDGGRERVCVWERVCVREGGRGGMYMYICVRERDRERGREGEREIVCLPL